MQPSFHLRRRAGSAVLLLCLYLLPACSVSQITRPPRPATTQVVTRPVYMVKIVADTSPIRKAMLEKRLFANPGLYYTLRPPVSVDTVPNLDSYLSMKASCDFEKSATPDGCVIVKYQDGFTKKICKGIVTEVTTPDGRKHVSWLGTHPMNTYMYMPPVPPPPNPDAQSAAYQWLSKYNDGLMGDVLLFLGNQQDLITQYKNAEASNCGNSIYKQIEYRTVFIENFLEAK